MPVLPHNLLTRSTTTAAAAAPAASGLASRLAAWYHSLDDTSGLKQALLSDTTRNLAKRGTEAAQAVLEDEQLKGYAGHSVKVAHDVADSVTVWYSELEPGYVARFGQWLGELWARVVMAFSGWGGWWEKISAVVAAVGSVFESFLVWCTGPQAIRLMIIWVSIVVVVQLLTVVVGFGPAGVVAGSLAAGFQAYAYGAFTPAGGFFAFLTSMGMLGLMMPLGLLAGAVLASFVTIICFFLGVGL
ncbi:uncharacterized protein H6S33_004661 [Morchella sextelata]|uniref:uncharacterized protein n=1 Tax=Morchella sextelata TaxID=1174677 RepID=UPI001D040A0E|nr:uncharacterized protein H6S33_004661 [Morchella sextelata]KAH0605439.1 hypothetical protein H6S33_004661 [Morchella sextelata]